MLVSTPSLGLIETPENRPASVVTEPVAKRRDIDTRFRPGQSGNPRGRPTIKHFRRALLKQFNTAIATDVKRGDVVADKVLSMAESGDLAAIEMLGDRLDGPVVADENTTNIGLAVTVETLGAKD